MHPDYPNNIVIKVDEGQSPSGKILDRGTHWNNLENYKDVIDYANTTNRKIYISINKRKYQKVSENLLEKLYKEYYENN